MKVRGQAVRALCLAALGILMGSLPGAGGLLAQGAFYQEEVKDGRIYVFNLMAVYEDWKKTGEMGKSITRVGAGPRGETVVFDSEEAIHLYNFRHGLPGEVMIKPPEKKPVAAWSWKDGKTTWESDKAALSLSNRVQFRYTHEMPQDEESMGSFRIRRAKTKFEGWIYTKDLTYELQMNWADTVDFTGRNQRFLEDAALNYSFTKGQRGLMIKGGQFKVPFARQELTSSGSQQFVDRSLVSSFFAGNSRDQGIQLWGLTPGGRFEYRVGMFNGNGINRSANDNDRFRVNARVVWQPFGEVRYSESDFETTGRPLLAIAAIYESNNLQTGDPNGTAPDLETFGGDVTFKYKGLSVVGDYFRRLIEPETAGAADTEARGWNVQAGLFVYKRFVEVAARYGTIDPSTLPADPGDPLANDHQFERGVALNWFLNKHNLKIQADYRQLESEIDDATDDEYRLQTQWIF